MNDFIVPGRAKLLVPSVRLRPNELTEILHIFFVIKNTCKIQSKNKTLTKETSVNLTKETSVNLTKENRIFINQNRKLTKETSIDLTK